MAGVWAAAATAVALIALLDTSGEDAERTATGVANRTEALEQGQAEQGERLDALEARVKDLAPAGDVSKLESRLARAEKDAKAANKDAKQANDQLTDLETRVSALEETPAATDGTGGTDGGAGSDDSGTGP